MIASDGIHEIDVTDDSMRMWPSALSDAPWRPAASSHVWRPRCRPQSARADGLTRSGELAGLVRSRGLDRREPPPGLRRALPYRLAAAGIEATDRPAAREEADLRGGDSSVSAGGVIYAGPTP